MRLTNVSHLRLPFGRLWGYDVSVSALDRRLPVSFDQLLHVGAGDRPGSATESEFVGTNFERKYAREGRPFHAIAAIRSPAPYSPPHVGG